MKKSEDKILSLIEKHGMLSVGDTVILAVSGGADSMCLLHFFNDYSRKMNINIICAHVNHGIRGAEADSDEEFVRAFCSRNGVDFRCAHYDVPSISSESGESLEECGRRLRYEFFNSIAPGAKIATAHNLNDSMETVIFNLARGTSLKGLTGIPPVRGNIIRPLLDLTRKEIEEYLSENGITFVTDSTNLSDDYARNKLRHKVIPVLTEINSGFASVFSNCAASLADAEEYLAKVTDEAYVRINKDNRFAVSQLQELDKAVRNRLLIKICENAGAFDISYKHIEIINSFLLSGGAVMLPGAVTVKSDRKYFYKTEEKLPDINIFEPFDKKRNEYIFPGITINIIDVDKSSINIYNNKMMSQKGYLDAKALTSAAVFRSRNTGDRFRFPYAEHSKSLKNLYKEKNIPPERRVGVPLLADEENVLWINGAGVSDYAKVTDETEKVVRIVASDSVKG